MSALRAVLDRLNDVEATISQVARDAGPRPSLALRLSIQSLERRRDGLLDELWEISQRDFVELCDYKIVPEQKDSYAISAITSAWHNFQDILSLVVGAIEAGHPRNSAKLARGTLERTQLNYGYNYAGSLGLVMTIQNERFLVGQTNLEKAVSAIFDTMRDARADKILEMKQNFGVPAVRKLYQLSKTHSEYGMSADIKWLRARHVEQQVFTQPPEFAEICRLIEAKSDTTTDEVSLQGTLLAWNTKTRTFVLETANGEQVSGRWAEDFEGRAKKTVPADYAAQLTKKTTVQYAEEKDLVVWYLHSLTRIGQYGE